MGLDIEERSWSKKHPVASTIIVMLFIAGLGTAVIFAQRTFFPVEPKITKTPVFVNESFKEVNHYFDINTNLTQKQQNELFDSKYRYNVFKWTCKPLSCQELIGKLTLKLVCAENGFTEDVRVAMQEDCKEAASRMEVTVVFQLLSKTTGDYYLGRAGKIVNE